MKERELPFPNSWGGRRSGAGRKPGARPAAPHRSRPEHKAAHPVHVTLRSRFRALRSRSVFPTFARAVAAANARDPDEFRIVHFSVQMDHVHLLVEARDKQALSTGMRGFVVRMARRINSLVRRRGKIWADR